jgi:hypothetical protein
MRIVGLKAPKGRDIYISWQKTRILRPLGLKKGFAFVYYQYFAPLVRF